MKSNDYMGLAGFIENGFHVEQTTTDAAFYNKMESQSGECLAEVYVPFDSYKPGHWADRCRCIDFVKSCGTGRILDFGPGDGWPSLIVAPFVARVDGLDASGKRVEICRSNAKRMGIDNAFFHRYQPGSNFPFDDNTFDGVMAASSIEQTPDVEFTVREIYRVLKPGSALRMIYESLDGYKGENECDSWVFKSDSDLVMILTFRQIKEMRASYYVFYIDLSVDEKLLEFSRQHKLPTEAEINALRPFVRKTLVCHNYHPNGVEWGRLLEGAGFRNVHATVNTGKICGNFTDKLIKQGREVGREEFEETLTALVEICIDITVPLSSNNPITAYK